MTLYFSLSSAFGCLFVLFFGTFWNICPFFSFRFLACKSLCVSVFVLAGCLQPLREQRNG